LSVFQLAGEIEGFFIYLLFYFMAKYIVAKANTLTFDSLEEAQKEAIGKVE